ncbi:hypothetical protein WHT83_06185 [Aminobacter sp. P9b]|uniref:hypothetical protein n=1 Tax=Aminobacter sp. P9b TaxID=3133697 RepID=UPI0032440EC3
MSVLGFLIGNPTLLAIMGGVVAALIAFITGNSRGARLQERKQAAEKLVAAEDRLEMDREATDADRRARDLSDAEATKEAMRWAKR